RAPMTRGEQLRLVHGAAHPDRPDGVDHITGGEIAGVGRFRISDLATAQRAALREDRRAAGVVNRAVDSAAAEKRLIRRVHDRVDLLGGYVTLDELDAAHQLRTYSRHDDRPPDKDLRPEHVAVRRRHLDRK